jgi:hypothetical protein
VFGNLGDWHLIEGAPEGTLEQRATALLQIWRERQNNPDPPGVPLTADIFRAMTLEIAVAAAQRLPSGIPAAVVELVREALPKWAYAIIDPAAVYSGEHGGKGAPDPLPRMRLKAICRDFDLAYAAKNGNAMSAKQLAARLIDLVRSKAPNFNGVQDRWGDAPNVERAIRRWRRDYQLDLDEAMKTPRGRRASGVRTKAKPRRAVATVEARAADLQEQRSSDDA